MFDFSQDTPGLLLDFLLLPLFPPVVIFFECNSCHLDSNFHSLSSILIAAIFSGDCHAMVAFLPFHVFHSGHNHVLGRLLCPAGQFLSPLTFLPDGISIVWLLDAVKFIFLAVFVVVLI